MEWIFRYGVVFIFSIQVKSLPHGVCNEYRRFEQGDTYRNITVTFCCDNFHKRNGVCVECPIGHHSKGVECNICNNEQYGRKCADTCRCNTTERCDHVAGCVAKYDRKDTAVTSKNYPSDSQVTDYKKSTPYDTDTVADDIFSSITLRDIILFVAQIFLGLLVCFGLMYMCWKRHRQRRILITPPTMIEEKADNVRRQQTEEKSESVYDEIDELAISEMSTPVATGTQLHNSYLEVTNGSCNTLNIIGKHNSICLAQFSSQSQPVRQTSRRIHRHSPGENMLNGLHLQTALGHYYSDGYLRPETIAQHHQINIMMENQGISFSIKDKVGGLKNDRHVYDRPVYDGIVRSASYDRLRFSKDEQHLTNGSMFVQNLIYPAKGQLENTNQHSKLATCFSKRRTI